MLLFLSFRCLFTTFALFHFLVPPTNLFVWNGVPYYPFQAAPIFLPAFFFRYFFFSPFTGLLHFHYLAWAPMKRELMNSLISYYPQYANACIAWLSVPTHQSISFDYFCANGELILLRFRFKCGTNSLARSYTQSQFTVCVSVVIFLFRFHQINSISGAYIRWQYWFASQFSTFFVHLQHYLTTGLGNRIIDLVDGYE